MAVGHFGASKALVVSVKRGIKVKSRGDDALSERRIFFN